MSNPGNEGGVAVPHDGESAWRIAGRLLREEKDAACRVLGVSMSPFLNHDDVIWLRAVKASELRFGDVVLYRDEDRRIVHRFLRRKMIDGKQALIIKGDAVPRSDPPVWPDQVLARAVRVDKGIIKINLESRSGRLLNGIVAILSSCPGLLDVARRIWRLLIPERLRVPSSLRRQRNVRGS